MAPGRVFKCRPRSSVFIERLATRKVHPSSVLLAHHSRAVPPSLHDIKLLVQASAAIVRSGSVPALTTQKKGIAKGGVRFLSIANTKGA